MAHRALTSWLSRASGRQASWIVAAATVLPTVGWAQGTRPASRWQPWVGCWTVTADATPASSNRADGDATATQPKRARVCVTAQGDEATISTAVGGAAPITQAIVANGTPRPFTEASCSGTQAAQWSRDGRRVYTRADLSCSAGGRRTVSGVSLLAMDGSWVETQAITIDGRDSVRVRRFTREGSPPAEARAVAQRLTIDDVKDMAVHVAAPAIEAAMVETRATFPLNARRLIELDEAKVPAQVIDLMVALTFPQAYRVQTAPADRVSTAWIDQDPNLYQSSSWFTPMATSYYDSAYYLSPFGYSYLGGYPIFGLPAVGLGTGRQNRGRNEDSSLEQGRVVNGQGYTRLVPRRAELAAEAGSGRASDGAGSRGEGGATVTTRGYTRGGSVDTSSSSPPPTSATSSTSGGSSSSGASSSGASSGGSGDSGRTAVPR